MDNRFDQILEALGNAVSRLGRAIGRGTQQSAVAVARARKPLIVVAVIAACAYAIWTHPPVQSVDRGDVAIRTNRLTGGVAQFSEGSVLAIPGMHQMRRFSTRDQIYRPIQSVSATGDSPFQSVEGLSIGVDLSVRYAIDPRRIARLSRELPNDVCAEVVQPIVQGVIYRLFASYTVREIFSSKRAEIQKELETQLRPKLAADGILLRSVQIGKVDLPQDYRHGMEKLLAEELETEKMRYTLELKDKRVKEVALDGEADKVRREKAAEASAREQIIAARGQEEAMQHVLPFKKKQIEQRQLEAEAEKVSRIRVAEGMAQARQIEAAGEAASRQKLADAEVYRLDRVGKVNSEQMQREGELITTHPLLIQKALADKLSDKVQVIIAAPPANGGFIGSNLLGIK
jgi:regulator of protease activity HflC (stomatin/prohibitin superfamily)